MKNSETVIEEKTIDEAKDKSKDKPKGTWAYTVAGKRVRGVLCLLTFMLFMLFLGLAGYVFEEFGAQILTDKEYDFYNSNNFYNRIRSEAEVIALCVREIEINNSGHEMQMIDAGKGVVNSYDVEAMQINDVNYIDNMADIKEYLTLTKNLTGNIYDYEYIEGYLDTIPDDSHCYMYLDNESFTRIFTENGIKNTDHRLSEMFSPNAYIIYLDKGVMDKLKEMDGFSEGVEETDSLHLEINDDSESFDYALETKKLMDDLKSLKYAAFDPETDVFYSTWDDYFSPFEHYIYDVYEVKSEMAAHSAIGEQVSSIIFPLLWSENMSDIWPEISASYVDTTYVESELDKHKNSAFVYYIDIDGGKTVYSNSNIKGAANNNISYYVAGSGYNGLMEYSPKDAEDFFPVDNIRKTLNEIHENNIMYFGIDRAKLSLEDKSDMASYMIGYAVIGKYIKYIVAGAVIAFVLLILQAAYLITTTGRKSKDDRTAKKVDLIRVDELPTELWFVIYMFSIGFSVLLIWIAMRVTGSGYKYDVSLVELKNSLVELRIILSGVLFSLPFGIVFMELTLSLARRIKAHNLRSRLYVRKLYRNTVLWVRNKKSADRLMIYTAVYIIIEIVLVAYIAIRCYKGTMGNVESALFGEVLFVIMWVVTIAAMSRVSSDIKKLEDGVAKITEGELDTKVVLNSKTSVFKELAGGINHIGDGLKNAVETSLKDERMKTELITNVSHDLKTPLTSIINYINLLKREKMPTPEAEHYVEVLDSKAQRLKQLTEDLVEAAKATSGNIELEMMPLSFEELVRQALGEFEDKFAEKNLTVVADYPGLRKSVPDTEKFIGDSNENGKYENGLYESALPESEEFESRDKDILWLHAKAGDDGENSTMVLADGRRLFRILDNVLQNAYKYAMENTRIYIDLKNEDDKVCFTMKNISRAQLNISADELMERFTRGDSSRTTEGSGLGLSIAKDLTKLMGGDFELELDGDLFKVIIEFPRYNDVG